MPEELTGVSFPQPLRSATAAGRGHHTGGGPVALRRKVAVSGTEVRVELPCSGAHLLDLVIRESGQSFLLPAVAFKAVSRTQKAVHGSRRRGQERGATRDVRMALLGRVEEEMTGWRASAKSCSAAATDFLRALGRGERSWTEDAARCRSADTHLRGELERREIGYVLAFACDHQITTARAGKFRADALVKEPPKRARQKLSADAGAKGTASTTGPWPNIGADRPGHHQLLVRRDRRPVLACSAATQPPRCHCPPWCGSPDADGPLRRSSPARAWPDS
ncbi:hypothetical protein SANTM175S_00617 [Streptomyces antimycoticus]